MALFAEKLLVLSKRETTYGTDPTAAGTDVAMMHDVTITPFNANAVERRPATQYFRGSERIPVGVHVRLEGSVEAASSGAAGTAPKFGGALLRGSGFAETITADTDAVYLPVSASYDSNALYFNMDGQRHKMVGVRGSVRYEVRSPDRPMLRFAFTGLYVAPGASAFPTPDWTGWQKPLIWNQANVPTLTLHGTSLIGRALNLDIAHRVVHRDLVGSESVLITGRNPRGEITIEAPALGTKNWFTTAKNETIGALQMIHGAAAGAIVQIDCPAVKVLNPRYSQEDGVAMLTMELDLLPSDGNDELKFTFK